MTASIDSPQARPDRRARRAPAAHLVHALGVALALAGCARERDPRADRAPAVLPADPGGPASPAHFGCPVAAGPLSPEVRAAIERALADERAAEARYGRAVTQFGTVRPFDRIERAERRHSAALEALLTAHGLAPAPAPTASEPPAYADVAAACAAGVQSERVNIAMYGELLRGDLPADVRCVFTHLQAASRERHLPAFERCAGTR